MKYDCDLMPDNKWAYAQVGKNNPGKIQKGIIEK